MKKRKYNYTKDELIGMLEEVIDDLYDIEDNLDEVDPLLGCNIEQDINNLINVERWIRRE